MTKIDIATEISFPQENTQLRVTLTILASETSYQWLLKDPTHRTAFTGIPVPIIRESAGGSSAEENRARNVAFESLLSLRTGEALPKGIEFQISRNSDSIRVNAPSFVYSVLKTIHEGVFSKTNNG